MNFERVGGGVVEGLRMCGQKTPAVTFPIFGLLKKTIRKLTRQMSASLSPKDSARHLTHLQYRRRQTAYNKSESGTSCSSQL